MGNIGLVWAELCDMRNEPIGIVISLDKAVYYVLKVSDSIYTVTDVKGKIMGKFPGCKLALTTIFGKCQLVYCNMDKVVTLPAIDLRVTGATYGNLTKIKVPFKDNTPNFVDINLTDVKSYVVAKNNEGEYVLLSIVSDKFNGYIIGSKLLTEAELKEKRKGKYNNIVYRDGVLEYRNTEVTKAFGKGFIPLNVLKELNLIPDKSEKTVDIIIQRNKLLYSKLRTGVLSVKPYTSTFIKAISEKTDNNIIIKRCESARQRTLVYYGHFGNDRTIVAAMDILLGTPSNFDKENNWCTAINNSLILAAGGRLDTEGAATISSYTFFSRCWKIVQTLCYGICNWSYKTPATLRHYILGFLASENIIGAMSGKNAMGAVKGIVTKFLTEYLSIPYTERGRTISFVNMLKEKGSRNYYFTDGEYYFKHAFSDFNNLDDLIDFITTCICTDMVIMRKRYCIEVLSSFAKVSRLYSVDDVVDIVSDMAQTKNGMEVLFEVCKYIRYQFLNPEIPVNAPLPFNIPFNVKQLPISLIMPVYSISRVYMYVGTDTARKYVYEDNGAKKHLHIMPSSVFKSIKDTKRVKAIPNSDKYSPTHTYMCNNGLLEPSKLQSVAGQHKNNKSLGLLLLFVNLAYNKFDGPNA